MAKRIPQQFLDDLLLQVDIVAVVDAVVPLKKRGTNYTACCPFHNEKTPSFSVSSTKQFYHCFGCQASGNAIGFVMAAQNLPFVDAVKYLADMHNIAMPSDYEEVEQTDPTLFEASEFAADYYAKSLRTANHAIDYLKKRGLSGQIAKQFNVGYAPAGFEGLIKQLPNSLKNAALAVGLILKSTRQIGQHYDRFRDRIMFPIRNTKGQVIAFGGRVLEKGEPKYLNSPESEIFHKSKTVYGLYEALKANKAPEYFVLVEGYMDVVALAQFGLSQAVATLGTACTVSHLRQLFRYSKTIVFCFDGDKAGRAAALKAAQIALQVITPEKEAKVLILPNNHDPDSFIRQYGLALFESRVSEAESVGDFLLNYLKSEFEVSKLQERAALLSMATPWVQSIKDVTFKQVFSDAVAKLSQTSDADWSAMSQAPAKPSVQKNAGQSQKIAAEWTPIRSAIAFVLQYPEAIAQWADDHPAEYEQIMSLKSGEGLEFIKPLPGLNYLQELLSSSVQYPALTLGQRLQKWTDDPAFSMLADLSHRSLMLAEGQDALERAWSETLISVESANHDHTVGSLIHQAKQQGLTESEKIILQNLLSKRVKA